jgi:hypothetical protein
MLTLEETLEQQKDLDKLCCDRPLQTKEIFDGNAFYGNDKIIKLYAQLPLDYPLKFNIPHGTTINDSHVWEAEIKSLLPILTYKCSTRKKANEKALIKHQRNKILIPLCSPIVYVSQLIKQKIEKKKKRNNIFSRPFYTSCYSGN